MNQSQCKDCVMDDSDPDLVLNKDRICNHCLESQRICNSLKDYQSVGVDQIIADLKLQKLKSGSKYHCIIGVSGGVDSSYVAFLAKQYGLDCLLVHLDNGWNSELAVENIENIVNHTGFDLYTLVIDWREFRDVQRAFFLADVVDLELISDHAIYASVYKLAIKHKVKYLLSGENLATESVMPSAWNWRKSDARNIKAIHKKFGSVKLKTFPFMSGIRKLYYMATRQVVSIPILNYLNYDKEYAKATIINEINWRDYGGKHHESIFTRFYQSYILPNKFNIDKRKAHLSSLINQKFVSKDDALVELSLPICNEQKLLEDKELVLKKLGFSEDFFRAYIQRKGIPHSVYGTDSTLYNLLIRLNRLLRKN